MCFAVLCISNRAAIDEHLPSSEKTFFVIFKRKNSKKCNGAVISKGYALGVECDAFDTKTVSEIKVITGVLSGERQIYDAVSKTRVPDSNYLVHIGVCSQSLNSRFPI